MERIKERRGDHELALEILGWIFRAQRLLRMDELIDILSMPLDNEDKTGGQNSVGEGDPDEMDPDAAIESKGEDEEEADEGVDDAEDQAKANTTDHGVPDLYGGQKLTPTEAVECCRGFVVYEESTGLVQFSHETVRKFIERELIANLPTAINIAKACISYLTSAQFDDSQEMEEWLQNYKFSRYAAQFWGLHTRGEAEKDPDIQRAVLSLLASKNKRDLILLIEEYPFSSPSSRDFRRGQTLLHGIAKIGLTTICELVLSRRINGNDTYVFTVDI
jgi:hypothetical protein